MKQKRTSGSGLFDKLLVPRIENYGTNNDITDTGAAAGWLLLISRSTDQ